MPLVQVDKFDKVLIDGRARAICAEYVLKFLHPKSVVFIHGQAPAHLLCSAMTSPGTPAMGH